MKAKPEPIEGPEAFARFDALVRRVLSVPHAEIVKREEAYQSQLGLNDKKRGPKLGSKRKPR